MNMEWRELQEWDVSERVSRGQGEGHKQCWVGFFQPCENVWTIPKDKQEATSFFLSGYAGCVALKPPKFYWLTYLLFATK